MCLPNFTCNLVYFFALARTYLLWGEDSHYSKNGKTFTITNIYVVVYIFSMFFPLFYGFLEKCVQVYNCATLWRACCHCWWWAQFNKMALAGPLLMALAIHFICQFFCSLLCLWLMKLKYKNKYVVHCPFGKNIYFYHQKDSSIC